MCKSVFRINDASNALKQQAASLLIKQIPGWANLSLPLHYTMSQNFSSYKQLELSGRINKYNLRMNLPIK